MCSYWFIIVILARYSIIQIDTHVFHAIFVFIFLWWTCWMKSSVDYFACWRNAIVWLPQPNLTLVFVRSHFSIFVVNAVIPISIATNNEETTLYRRREIHANIIVRKSRTQWDDLKWSCWLPCMCMLWPCLCVSEDAETRQWIVLF